MILPAAAFAQKFGCVDYDAVAQALPDYSKVMGELQAQQKQYENDLKAMQDELQRKAEEYEKAKSTMNATKQQETEQSLMDMQAKIQQAYQDNGAALQKAQQEKLQPIQAKVAKAVENVGNNGGYVYIVMKGSFPYISATQCTDVTEDCKKEILKLK